MKSRLGFVSNSSSSSFTLVGIVVNEKDIQKELGLDIDPDYDYVDDAKEALEKHFKGKLEICTGLEEYKEDDFIIGKDIHEMKDKQTLKEFKEGVLKILVEKGWKPNNYKRIKIVSDAGYGA